MLNSRSQPVRRWTFSTLLMAAAIVLFAAGLVLFAMPEGASANGATRLIVNDTKSGPYIFRVGILPGNPKVGLLHVSILVQAAEAGVSANDTTVTITAAGPEGSAPVTPARAVNSAQNPQTFEGNITLSAVGSWTMTVHADSGLGSAALDVPLQVTKSEGFNLLYIIIAVVAVIVLGSLAWSQSKGSRRRSTR